MKKLILFCAALAVANLMLAQSNTAEQTKTDKPKKVKASLYGFVRNYFNYDSRNSYVSNGGEYYMLPYDEKWNCATQAQADALDIERFDQNAVPQAHFLALTTRFGLNLEGPDVLGAATSGKIEADFAGFSTTNTVLRIRHAYVKLNWNNGKGLTQELLAGQTWHPLSGDIMPEALGMAAGAPFRAHSRTPQLRYILYNGHIGFTAAAIYQLQYMYNGPSYSSTGWSSTNSTSFANTAVMPELFLGVQYKDEHIYTQIGSTCQPLRPRTVGMVERGTGLLYDYPVPVNELLVTFTPTLYFQYTQNIFSVKFRTMLAQNTSHVNQLNGYAVTNVLEDGTWEYAPLKASISYLDFAVGKKYRANLFLGYMKNFGAGQDLHNFNPATSPAPHYYIYMKGGENFTHLNSIYRIAPSVSYNLPHFNFGLEYEWTACTYGDIATDGSILNNDNLHRVSNHRICALIKYNF